MTFWTNSSEIEYGKVVLGTKFARFDIFCPKSILVLVSGMSFLALARNLTLASESDSTPFLTRWLETINFDAFDEEI